MHQTESQHFCLLQLLIRSLVGWLWRFRLWLLLLKCSFGFGGVMLTQTYTKDQIWCDSIHPIYLSSKVQKTTSFFLVAFPDCILNFKNCVRRFFAFPAVKCCAEIFRLLSPRFSLPLFFCCCFVYLLKCLLKSLSIICILQTNENGLHGALPFSFGCAAHFYTFPHDSASAVFTAFAPRKKGEELEPKMERHQIRYRWRHTKIYLRWFLLCTGIAMKLHQFFQLLWYRVYNFSASLLSCAFLILLLHSLASSCSTQIAKYFNEMFNLAHTEKNGRRDREQTNIHTLAETSTKNYLQKK